MEGKRPYASQRERERERERESDGSPDLRCLLHTPGRSASFHIEGCCRDARRPGPRRLMSFASITSTVLHVPLRWAGARLSGVSLKIPGTGPWASPCCARRATFGLPKVFGSDVPRRRPPLHKTLCFIGFIAHIELQGGEEGEMLKCCVFQGWCR